MEDIKVFKWFGLSIEMCITFQQKNSINVPNQETVWIKYHCTKIVIYLKIIFWIRNVRNLSALHCKLLCISK